jgi:hypothetical protein
MVKKNNTFWDMVFEDYNKNKVFEQLADRWKHNGGKKNDVAKFLWVLVTWL